MYFIVTKNITRLIVCDTTVTDIKNKFWVTVDIGTKLSKITIDRQTKISNFRSLNQVTNKKNKNYTMLELHKLTYHNQNTIIP